MTLQKIGSISSLKGKLKTNDFIQRPLPLIIEVHQAPSTAKNSLKTLAQWAVS